MPVQEELLCFVLLLQGCWCHQLVTVTFLPAAEVASPGASSDALAQSLSLPWLLAPCTWDIAPAPVTLLYIVPRLCVMGADVF